MQIISLKSNKPPTHYIMGFHCGKETAIFFFKVIYHARSLCSWGQIICHKFKILNQGLGEKFQKTIQMNHI